MGLVDYKFYCFDGKPKYVAVEVDRLTNHTAVFYDLEWKQQEFNLVQEITKKEIRRPKNLDEMIVVAKSLSESIPFCTVDLYHFSDRILFGEITFFTAGGFGSFTPPEYDLIFGNMIPLPKKTKYK